MDERGVEEAPMYVTWVGMALAPSPHVLVVEHRGHK